MALKNLYDMVKADRYTADGREALIKAQEAETEDKVYQIGEISQKTGLQKTANGWVKPKNGKQPGAASKHDTDPQTYIVKKNDELRKMYLNEKDPAKKEAMKKALKKQASMMEPEPFSSTESKTAEKPALSQTDGKGNKVEIKISESKGGGFYVDKYVNGKKVGINNANTRESAEAKAKSMMEQHMADPDYKVEEKPAAGNNLPDIPDFKGMESGDYDKKLRAEGWTTGGWEGSGTHASAIFKKGDRTIRVNEGQPGKITSVQEISKSAAPRREAVSAGRMMKDLGGNFWSRPEDFKEDITSRGWDVDEMTNEYAVISNEAGSQYEVRFDDHSDDGDLTVRTFKALQIDEDDEDDSLEEDAAPKIRQLTGDTRIRVRKA